MLAKYSVKKPFTVLVGVILVIVLGFMSFSRMTADLLPNINLPYVLVMTTYPGASPEKVESVVTEPLEQAFATTANVKNVSSVSNENVSMLMLEFEESTNMDSALIELNSKIDLVEAAWKNETVGTPTVLKLNPNMLPVMIAAVDVKDMPSSDLTYFISEKITPELEKTNGVASVSTSGAIEEKITIRLSQEKIDTLNEKILENIDEELSKTEKELKNAKAEITKGKAELEKQSAEQTKKLADGLNAINAGEQELINALTTLESKEKQLQILKNVLETGLEIITPENETQVLSDVNNKLNTLDEDSDVRPSLNIKEGITEALKTKLTEVNDGLNEINTTKTSLNSKLTEVSKQKTELENAKTTLQNELQKAASKLSSGETQINQGLSELDSARETAYKNASLDGVITQSMISGILTTENFSMPAGYIETEDDSIVVKVGEQFTSLDEIKDLTILSLDIDGLESVKLQDLADIEIEDNSNDVYTKVNGNNGVILSFQKQSTAATATVANDIKDTFAELEEKYDDVKFTVLMDQGVYIDMVVSSVLENLIYGAILAIIILFLFLRDLKPTIAVALSIPASLTFAITLMYFTGVTVNVISLSGLALSVGMLVDNAIVVIENTYRLRNAGMPAGKAAIKGASSVAGAIFASTLTTICVFTPIVFIEGMTRELFMDMALTIAYSLLASLIVALTVVPAMTAKLFKKEKEVKHNLFDKFVRGYEKILKLALNHKAIVLTSSVVLLIISGVLVSNMGTAFIPSMEGTQMSLTMEFDKDTAVQDGNDMSNTVIERLLEIEDIETIGAMRQSGGMLTTSGDSNSISMYLILKEDKKLTTTEIEKQILEKTEDLNCEISVSTSNMDMSAMGGSGIQVLVKGNELDKLQEIANDIAEIMKNTEGMTEIDNGIGETSLETKIIVDKNKAMEYGLTVAQIYSTIAEKLTLENEATNVTIDNKEYPVIVIKKEEDKLTKDNIGDIELSGNKNNEEVTVDLSELVSINETDSMKSISRENSSRYVSVSAMIDSDHNIGLVSRDFEKELEKYEVPEGYSIELAGENETINEAIYDLLLMIALAILLIYLVMVAQFQSLKSPFIVMFTIPLAFTGGLFALAITGKELSVIAMLGFLVLAGIVVNNGIVLIDYLNQLIAQGKTKKEAIIEAGKTRLRPIIMTALTTILGMSTMALGIGMGADMIQSLGIVTIGGLLYATVLTLVVVPCMYDLMFRKVK